MTEAELAKLLSNYQPSDTAIDAVKRSKIILLVGITAAGKNTLKKELLKDSEFYDFISHTTRSPRINSGVEEKDGIDYFFITSDKAKQMILDGDFIEAKKVHSNVYGTAVAGLTASIESGRIAVNDVDVQGVDEYKAISSEVHAIFLIPPSLEKWNERRMARYDGVIDSDDNKIRMDSARKELQFALNKGYFDFVVNEDVEMAAREVKAIANNKKNEAASMAAKEVAAKLYEELSTH